MKALGALLVVLLVLIWYLHSNKQKLEHFTQPIMPDVLEIPGNNNKILIIGGVHGNEPAGTAGIMKWLQNYVKNKPANSPSLIVIPNANIWGLANNSRYLPRLLHADLNRNFTNNGGSEPVSDFIAKIINDSKPDLVVDFHEGWGFHKIEPDSIGSTVTSNSLSVNLGAVICDQLNSQIIDADKKFTHRVNIACDIDTTLGCMCEKLKIPYILVETTGQNDRQPMEIRTNQVGVVLDVVVS